MSSSPKTCGAVDSTEPWPPTQPATHSSPGPRALHRSDALFTEENPGGWPGSQEEASFEHPHPTQLQLRDMWEQGWAEVWSATHHKARDHCMPPGCCSMVSCVSHSEAEWATLPSGSEWAYPVLCTSYSVSWCLFHLSDRVASRMALWQVLLD